MFLNLYSLFFKTTITFIDRQCKCHGVSGSCEFQVCWRSLRSFSQIASKLKEYYDGAIEVRLQRSLFDKRLRFIPRNLPFHTNKQTISNNSHLFDCIITQI